MSRRKKKNIYDFNEEDKIFSNKVIDELARKQYCKNPPKDATEKQLKDFYSKCVPGINPNERRKYYQKAINRLINKEIASSDTSYLDPETRKNYIDAVKKYSKMFSLQKKYSEELIPQKKYISAIKSGLEVPISEKILSIKTTPKIGQKGKEIEEIEGEEIEGEEIEGELLPLGQKTKIEGTSKAESLAQAISDSLSEGESQLEKIVKVSSPYEETYITDVESFDRYKARYPSLSQSNVVKLYRSYLNEKIKLNKSTIANINSKMKKTTNSEKLENYRKEIDTMEKINKKIVQYYKKTQLIK
jgi:hypothetical protein